MATALVTLEQAKAHLYIVDATHDDDVMRKVEQATGIILDYLESDAETIADWADGTEEVPGAILSAILLMLTHLYENRGNDMKPDAEVWKAVERLLLGRHRDPVIA